MFCRTAAINALRVLNVEGLGCNLTQYCPLFKQDAALKSMKLDKAIQAQISQNFELAHASRVEYS